MNVVIAENPIGKQELRIKRVMSGWDISGKPQSLTSTECKDTSLTNKFNPCCRDNSCAEVDVGANMQTNVCVL